MGCGELSDKPPCGASNSQELNFATKARLWVQPILRATLSLSQKSRERAASTNHFCTWLQPHHCGFERVLVSVQLVCCHFFC